MSRRRKPQPRVVRRWLVDHLHRDTAALDSRIVEGTVAEHAWEIAAKTTTDKPAWQPVKPSIYTTTDGVEIQVRELDTPLRDRQPTPCGVRVGV